MPPKPRMPAISATIRNVTTQLNMIRTSVCVSIGAAMMTAPSTAEIIRPGNDGSGLGKAGKLHVRHGTKSRLNRKTGPPDAG